MRIATICHSLLFAVFVCGEMRAELVAHWPLREVDGTEFVDLVGGNHGFVPEDAAVSFALDGPEGVAPNSVVFTGDDGPSYIQTPYFGIGGADPRTIAAWVKAEPQSRATAVVAYGSLDSGRKWHFRIENTRIRTEFSGGQNYGGDTDLGDGVWHHIVTVFPDGGVEGDDVIHYIDGVVEPQLGGTSPIIDTAIDPEEGAFPLHIGLAIGHDGRWFEGQIADVRVYDEALDAAAIAALMTTPSMLPPGEPGDFNADGAVNVADFLVLAENFNTTHSLLESYARGDFDLNARVNMADFFAFRQVLAAQQAGAAAVPEPAGLVLIAIATFSVLALRRRRR